jgi:predicted CXXCH cytochrome family protein
MRSALFAWLGALLSGLVGLALLGAPGHSQSPQSLSVATGHVGSATCATCHAAQTTAWRSSHHAHAMAPATAATVKGDFSAPAIEVAGSRARFARDGDRFTVETEGRDGTRAAFVVTDVLGIEPLQQYLVRFPDGRIQVLPWAWDTRPRAQGGQRWFHVYGDDPVPASDPRHWTRLLQGWNHMCAECHVTAMDKGYDPVSDSFRSTWTEPGVGCEGCHGAGGAHVAWARAGASSGDAGKGFAHVSARRPAVDWTPDPVTGSPKASVARPAGDEVELCARCHARRGPIASTWSPGRPLADTHRPALLSPDLFEDDGQMRDEVFNDHAFKQSLMYAKGVSCGDCHDPHSGQLRAAGSAVCGQCHDSQRFAAVQHTGHPAGPSAPDCIACHMPVRTYMQVDRRHDHSFRVPRPDLSVALGTSNACTDCHRDRDAAWAATAVERWHGPTRRGHQVYTKAFHATRVGDPSARELLQALAIDAAVPAVARATAVEFLRDWPSVDTETAVVKALADQDPLVRATALRQQDGQPPEVRWRRAAPALHDPVRLVRLTSALVLADRPVASIPAVDRAAFDAATAELETSLQIEADRPDGRAGMAQLRIRQGRLADAEAEYRAGLRLEPAAVALSVNLADLLRRLGREGEGEPVLRAGLALTPDSAALHHALGLSLVRSRRIVDAMEHLRRAVEAEPASARYAYVYGVALQTTGRPDDALRVMRQALARSPSDANLLAALLQAALRSNDTADAGVLAARLARVRPDDPEIARLAARLRR